MEVRTLFAGLLIATCAANASAQERPNNPSTNPDVKSVLLAATGIALGSYVGWEVGWHQGGRIDRHCAVRECGMVPGKHFFAPLGAITIGSVSGPLAVKLGTDRDHFLKGVAVALPFSIVGAALSSRMDDSRPVQIGFMALMLGFQSSWVAHAMRPK